MICCRVCGEEKERSQFYKIKHFYKYLNTNKVWCRECQKLYVEMKKQEMNEKIKDFLKGQFCVSFD